MPGSLGHQPAFGFVHQSLAIPEHVHIEILPLPVQSILDFSAFQCPTVSLSMLVPAISSLLSSEKPTVVDVAVIYRIPLPGAATVKELAQQVHEIALSSPSEMPASIVVLHVSSTQQRTLPMWVITYWVEIMEMHAYWAVWVEALADLRKCEQLWVADERQTLIKQIFDVLSLLPWLEKIRGFDNPEPIHTLATYTIRKKWLTNVHENQLLDLLRNDLRQAPGGSKMVVENLDFIDEGCIQEPR